MRTSYHVNKSNDDVKLRQEDAEDQIDLVYPLDGPFTTDTVEVGGYETGEPALFPRMWHTPAGVVDLLVAQNAGGGPEKGWMSDLVSVYSDDMGAYMEAAYEQRARSRPKAHTVLDDVEAATTFTEKRAVLLNDCRTHPDQGFISSPPERQVGHLFDADEPVTLVSSGWFYYPLHYYGLHYSLPGKRGAYYLAPPQEQPWAEWCNYCGASLRGRARIKPVCLGDDMESLNRFAFCTTHFRIREDPAVHDVAVAFVSARAQCDREQGSEWRAQQLEKEFLMAETLQRQFVERDPA